ncbi:putative amidohydrolase [Kordia periserrulae]|uniref:Omega-amidase YafV n=1 Tax=Kordia periserrulae TaxID=701523 RepID=A0A2T6C6L6_9FLAO|nr:amidohydrolase [Kordia periserrulae]PTX63970.1 putative amidohydrolase [Kordia periserrulae]
MESEQLKVALVQTNLVWEHPAENRQQLAKKIDAITETVDIIVLPEMFTSGFTMNPKAVAETMGGETIRWLKNTAKTKNVAITGSLVITENNNYYNRSVFVLPSGEVKTYDKKHTFTLAGEHKVYTAGTSKTIIDYKGWKICSLICYDLRFPVWARNVENYDVLLYVANWPKPRVNAWDALLKARAIENMSYCIGVNRVGLDANSNEYSGHSAAYDVLGEKLTNIPSNQEATEIVTLTKAHIATYRNKLKFLDDKDAFTLNS